MTKLKKIEPKWKNSQIRNDRTAWQGRLGIVYKAFDPLMERQVAIKVLAEQLFDQPEIKERFYREARSAGKLSHENITIVHDLGEIEGKRYIVMEYLPGNDLKQIKTKRKT